MSSRKNRQFHEWLRAEQRIERTNDGFFAHVAMIGTLLKFEVENLFPEHDEAGKVKSDGKPLALGLVFGLLFGVILLAALSFRDDPVNVPPGCAYVEESGSGWLLTDAGYEWVYVDGPHIYCEKRP